MKTFKKYARYYDTFYIGKEYGPEVDFLQKVIKKYSQNKVKTILSLGCGTATHDILLAKKRFDILGIDASKEMISIASEKAKAQNTNIVFKVADMARFRVAKKFDASMAMFNVVGYMTENSEMASMLKSVHSNLKKDGLFFFDCWYGPAVLKSRPENKTRKIVVGGKEITRITTQRLDIEKSLIDISFELREGNKKIAKETHSIRFWYLKELESFLEGAGFRIIKTCNFMDVHSKISEDNWNMFVIAKKQ